MFVKLVCGFPGSAVVQCVEMAAACVAMTAVCLAFSSIFSSSDKANLVSIYLVGFQLPLSGIVLALPESLKWVCRPFISAYWGWAGYMSSMRESRIYDAYVLTKPDWDFIPVALSCALGDGRPDRDCACRRVLGVLAQKL